MINIIWCGFFFWFGWVKCMCGRGLVECTGPLPVAFNASEGGCWVAVAAPMHIHAIVAQVMFVYLFVWHIFEHDLLLLLLPVVYRCLIGGVAGASSQTTTSTIRSSPWPR